jgi:tetratricopeptide (TPR) repeat protein
MKIKKNRKLPQANKVFADREEPRYSFWKSYDKCKQNMASGEEVQVLTYYGIGGIGKTSLLMHLISEMNERIERPMSVYVDFNVIQETRAVLGAMRNKLVQGYEFQFPLFDIAAYIYSKKIGEKVLEDEPRGFIEKSDVLNTVFSILGAMPIIGFASQLITAADKGTGFIKRLVSRRKRELTEIDVEPPEAIFKKLPYYFAQDLGDNMEEATEPLVIFFDTYEMLVNEMSSAGEPMNRDLWIRGEDGLIQNTPRVMWVIAGREKIKRDTLNAEWGDALEQHILGDLSESDSTYFLNSAGIYDEYLIASIYKLTNGTPVFLDLCVDSYYSLIDAGKIPVIDDFGSNIANLIERFARYMDDSKKDIVYLLSCMKIWNDELFSEVANAVIPGYSFTTYEKIKGFSFVISQDGATYYMHQTIREILYKNCPQFIKEKAKLKLLHYYENKLEETAVTSVEFGNFFSIYVAYRLETTDTEESLAEFYAGLDKKLGLLFASSQYEFLCGQMANIADFADKSFPMAAITGKIHRSYAEYLLYAGKYEQALEQSQKSYSIYYGLYGDSHEHTIDSINMISQSYSRLGNYGESYNHIARAYKLGVANLGEEHLVTMQSLHWMAARLDELGAYKEALGFAEKALAMRKKVLGEDSIDTTKTMNNLANYYDRLGRHEKSLDLREKVLKKRTSLLGEEHYDTVTAMGNLASSYASLGRYQESLELRERVLEKRIALLGEDHPDTISAMGGLAGNYAMLGRYQESLELRERVLEKRIALLGEDHPHTISAMGGLARNYASLGRYQESLGLLERVFEKRTALLGEDHPDTISTMNGLAGNYASLGLYQESLELRARVFEKRTAFLGEDHPDTISAMNWLASNYAHLGRYQEALELSKRVLEKRTALLGGDHPDTLSAMNELAFKYVKMKMFDDALPLAETAVEGKIELYGEDHVNIAASLDTLSECCSELGRHDRAIALQKSAYEILLRDFGRAHKRTINYLSALADRYRAADMPDKASELADEVTRLSNVD